MDQQYRFLADYARSEGAGAVAAKAADKPQPAAGSAEKPAAPRKEKTADGGELEIEVAGGEAPEE